MMLGTCIRLALVCSWLGLFGWHTTGVISYYYGVNEARDLPHIIRNHIDYTYQYDMLQGDKHIGSISQDYEFVDGRYPMRTNVELKNFDFIPGLTLIGQTLLTGAGIDLSQGVSVSTTTTLDKDFQLREVEVAADVGGSAFDLNGQIDHEGFKGNWQWEGSDYQPITFANIDRSQTQGIGLAAALPPNLKPGESFQTASISPQATPPYMKRSYTHYFVEQREAEPHNFTKTKLLRVRLEKDQKAIGTIWCDDRGTIIESHDSSLGLRLKLRTVFHKGVRVTVDG